MEKHIEKEYKILVDKQQFHKLLSLYPKKDAVLQVNYYYDNEAMDIMHHHGAMRIREKEGIYIFTLKMYINHDLMEYECEVKHNHPDIFTTSEIKGVLNQFHIQGPFSLINRLETYRIMYEYEDYELCFDENYYHHTQDYEIEYEYKKAHDGYTNFNTILNPIGLTYTQNCVSKIQRAYESK